MRKNFLCISNKKCWKSQCAEWKVVAYAGMIGHHDVQSSCRRWQGFMIKHLQQWPSWIVHYWGGAAQGCFLLSQPAPNTHVCVLPVHGSVHSRVETSAMALLSADLLVIVPFLKMKDSAMPTNVPNPGRTVWQMQRKIDQYNNKKCRILFPKFRDNGKVFPRSCNC